MARSILGEFGPERSEPKPSPPGGVTQVKDVRAYQPPVGPKYIDREGPGLRGGINHGNCGSQRGK